MKIIVFEGIDKAGKHSQSELLKKYLEEQGYKVVKSEFHRYDTPTGELIMKWLRKEWEADQYTIELLMAADKQAQQRWFKELEEQGVDYLILDRYIRSQVAYALANDMNPRWIYELLKHLRKPDIEIYIDISPEESMRRKGKHNNGVNDRYESDFELLKRAREYYLNVVGEACENQWIIVDGSRPTEEVHQEIIKQLYYCDSCKKIVPSCTRAGWHDRDVEGEMLRVLAVMRFCTDCWSELFDPELEKRNHRAALNQYRIEHGLLMPEAIRSYRERLGLTYKEAASQIGISPELWEAYESGTLQSKEHDQLIRGCLEVYN